jgi:hypothetical protein
MPLLTGIFASAISGNLTPADAGSMFPLGEFTLASAQSSITFSNIPQTYTHLQIRGHINAPDDWSYRFNSDSGSNYSAHLLYGGGSSVTASALAPLSRGYIGYGAGSGNLGSFVLDILDYRNTNKYTTTKALAGYDANGSGIIMLNSASWRNTAAITSIQIFPSSGNLAANSAFQLYGVNA